jgi:hypothetical protein
VTVRPLKHPLDYSQAAALRGRPWRFDAGASPRSASLSPKSRMRFMIFTSNSKRSPSAISHSWFSASAGWFGAQFMNVDLESFGRLLRHGLDPALGYVFVWYMLDSKCPRDKRARGRVWRHRYGSWPRMHPLLRACQAPRNGHLKFLSTQLQIKRWQS